MCAYKHYAQEYCTFVKCISRYQVLSGVVCACSWSIQVWYVERNIMQYGTQCLAGINKDWRWAVPVALVGVGVALGLLKGVRAIRIPWAKKF